MILLLPPTLFGVSCWDNIFFGGEQYSSTPSRRWNQSLKRWLLPEEMVAVMGLPVTENQSKMALVKDHVADLSMLSTAAKDCAVKQQYVKGFVDGYFLF